MFGIGMTEIVVILVIALLIFGPNKLPELARSLGKGFGEFRRASYDLRQSLMEVTDEPPSNPAPEAAAPQRPDQAITPPPPDAPPPKAESEVGPAPSKSEPKVPS
ncbi:MAG: twin-arginine translocase TatA/TatE family subunit [Deltaproteobacteria bacterium]|nr:twin-arginine translocase TatA/TatE family subunit [Deltaproteobacteria bacterium]MBW2446833.1 twin-arginine translocase TatA/TatE family subunit [Deltaproteobacteria bacterium]